MKRKGIALQLEAVVAILVAAILSFSAFFVIINYQDHEKIERMRQLEAIRVALIKYAKNHRGIAEPVGGFELKDVTHTYTEGSSQKSQQTKHMVYEAPGLFPKDLNELVELGYLEPYFFGVITGADSGYSGNTNYIKFDTYSNSAPSAKVYGTDTEKIIYQVFPDPNLKETTNGKGFSMYTKCTLKYEGPKFSIGPWTITLSRTKIKTNS